MTTLNASWPGPWEFIELPQADGQLALASVHTGRANRIVEAALEAGELAPLAGYATLRREVKWPMPGSILGWTIQSEDGRISR
ncbi:hypothetical protein HORIV_05020 [Vreelandella olivaria]|uniref:Uncharacterized protein n=1 Tax=Vreelandella olivaria TaxID=390919 RepID=A0ABM9SCP5_9GAMM|nr:hypothetical protein HORIV_05020 [Halomonas olivaria]